MILGTGGPSAVLSAGSPLATRVGAGGSPLTEELVKLSGVLAETGASAPRAQRDLAVLRSDRLRTEHLEALSVEVLEATRECPSWRASTETVYEPPKTSPGRHGSRKGGRPC